MVERFNERATRAMQFAVQESQRLKHDHLGTEHLLLGLAKEGTGLGEGVLFDLRLDLEALRKEIERRCHGPNTANPPTNPRQTSRLKRIVGYAIEEAARDRTEVGTEHLLLAILREPESTAAKSLATLQCTAEQVRHVIRRPNATPSPGGEALCDRAVRDIKAALVEPEVSPETLRSIADALIKAGWRPQS
jgi:ATP-dependent Clp protease ATP-binding subunit ClpC